MASARADSTRQRETDSNRQGVPAMFFARVKAVLEAQDAVARGEIGAVPASGTPTWTLRRGGAARRRHRPIEVPLSVRRLVRLEPQYEN
jgi:hypothetical protein